MIIAKGEKAKYVSDTYVWLREVYDGMKPIHHLTLIIAIITSLMLPNLWLPDDDLILQHFEGTTLKEEVHAVYESIPWVEKDREKGMKEKLIFVAMFSTFIIAIYEPDRWMSLRGVVWATHGLTNMACFLFVFAGIFVHSDLLFVLQVLKASNIPPLFTLE